MTTIIFKTFPYSRAAVILAERGGFPFYCAVFTSSYKSLDILVQDTEKDRGSGAYHRVARILMKDVNRAYKVFEDVLGQLPDSVRWEFNRLMGEKILGAHMIAYRRKGQAR